MKVIYKPKLSFFTPKYEVENEQGEVIYRIKGRFITFTDKKEIFDKDGNLLYVVKNKLFTIFYKRAFLYDANKNKICRITRKLFTFKENFFVDGFNQNVRIDGDLIGLKFNMFVDDKMIAKVAVESLVNRFIEVDDPEDLPIAIALLTSCYNIIRQKAKK